MHYPGCPSFVPLLRKLCVLTGDSLDIHEYDRLLPLKTSTQAICSYNHIRDGDCIISFSRKEIHKIRAKIESLHKDLSCYVVYGSLPPESRKEQARLFNYATQLHASEPPEEIAKNSLNAAQGTVLIASDAIGTHVSPHIVYCTETYTHLNKLHLFLNYFFFSIYIVLYYIVCNRVHI